MSAPLPQLSAPHLADGGIETSLIFDDGIDLPDFAAFLLLADEAGREALRRYFARYAAIAARDEVGIVLETPTWRASSDWGARHGYDAEAMHRVNVASVGLVRDAVAGSARGRGDVVVSGCLGPRGDGYQPGQLMSAEEARHYHAAQVRALAAGGVDLVTAITMLYPAEAIGITEAAREAGVPVAISFTVETDGRLPTGQTLASAITEVDDTTGGHPAYFMVNCAHPTHFEQTLQPAAPWVERIRGVRANASSMSHAELDEAEELDAGDPVELAEQYAALLAGLPALTVFGGCCGTNEVHIDAISARVVAAAGR